MVQSATVPQFATSPVDILNWQRALFAEPALTHVARSVATSLSHFINSKSGFAWPSLRTLARRSESSLSSVKRALKQLATLGFLQIEPGGCRRTNRYRAVLRRAAPAVEGSRPAAEVSAPLAAAPMPAVEMPAPAAAAPMHVEKPLVAQPAPAPEMALAPEAAKPAPVPVAERAAEAAHPAPEPAAALAPEAAAASPVPRPEHPLAAAAAPATAKASTAQAAATAPAAPTASAAPTAQAAAKTPPPAGSRSRRTHLAPV